MYKKLLTLSILAIIGMITMISGCKTNNESLTVFKMESFNVPFNETEITRSITLNVYHKDGYVNKTDMVEVNTVVNANSDDMNELKTCTMATDMAFDSDMFKVNGFEHSIEFADTSYTLKTTYDYSKINIKKEIENGKEFLHIKGMIDEDYKIPYEKVKEAYTLMGYTCEEGH